MSNVPTAFEIFSFTTTALTMRITEYGKDGLDIGDPTDVYTVVLRYPNNNTRVFTASPGFFAYAPNTFAAPSETKEIQFSGAGWNQGGIPVVVTSGVEMTVTVENQTKITIDPGEELFTVTSGGETPPTITATADYTAGVTVTITNFGTGSGADTFNLLIDEGLGTAQTKNGLTTWTENTPRTIPWSEFTPSGVNGRVGGETITIKLTNTTADPDTNSNIISTTLTGSAPPGVPCFVAASNLLTPTGYCAAKDIKTGDLLMTADGRKVPVKAFSFTVEVADKDSAPFFISKNSISMGCPNSDLRLSPWHAFQMKKGLWMKPMSALELGMSVQQYDIGKPVTYYHFEAPNFFKDNFVCEGTVVESFGGLQTKDMKGRVYTYNPSLKGYTRVASKPVSKAVMM